MRFQTTNNQATNSPSKIEGAGGEYDDFVEFSLIVRCFIGVHTPPNPLYLRGGTNF